MANLFENREDADKHKHEQEKREAEKRHEAEQRKHEHHETEQKEHGVTSVHRKRHEDEDEEDEPLVTHPSSEHGTPHDVQDQPTLERRLEDLERRVEHLEKPPHALSPAAKHDSHSLSPEQVAQVEQLMAEHLQRTIGHSGEPAYGTSIDEPAG